MSNHPTPDNENPTGGVHIGDVFGGIHNSIIAERVYIQATKTNTPLTPEQRQEIERLYLERVAEECRYLETEGVDQKRPELTDIFVMLEAVEDRRLGRPLPCRRAHDRARRRSPRRRAATL